MISLNKYNDKNTAKKSLVEFGKFLIHHDIGRISIDDYIFQWEITVYSDYNHEHVLLMEMRNNILIQYHGNYIEVEKLQLSA